MFEKLLELLARIATALEKLAAGGTAPETKAEKPKKEKPAKEETKTVEPEKKVNLFADDEAPAAPKRTKEEVRKLLADYANATSNDRALEELANATSNKAQRIPDIKPEEYDKVYAVFEPLLAATKK